MSGKQTLLHSVEIAGSAGGSLQAAFTFRSGEQVEEDDRSEYAGITQMLRGLLARKMPVAGCYRAREEKGNTAAKCTRWGHMFVDTCY